MKIALLIEKFLSKGGAERMAGYVVRGLVERGHEVHVYATAFDGEGYVRHPVEPGSHTEFAERCKAALAGARYDVVHSFTRTLSHDILRLGGGIHAEYLRRTAGARSLIGRAWAAVNPKEKAILALERDGLAAARLVQAVSERVRREAIEEYGVAPAKIVVTYNAVDTARFHPDLRREREVLLRELSIPGDAFVLLFVGSGARRKGLANALAAHAAVADPRAHLVVVGDANPPSQARVHAVGVRQDVERFYGAADAFVFPTLYDPFPNVTLEAMACGVPVIVTRVAGTSEIITDGNDSFVVDDPGEPAAIAARIRALMAPAFRDTMGRAARALVERRPVSQYIDDTVALYRSLVPSP